MTKVFLLQTIDNLHNRCCQFSRHGAVASRQVPVQENEKGDRSDFWSETAHDLLSWENSLIGIEMTFSNKSTTRLEVS